MGVGPVCRTSLSTGLSEWELGPHQAERSPILFQFQKYSYGNMTPNECELRTWFTQNIEFILEFLEGSICSIFL